MRAGLRLFAAIKPGRYLEAGQPTGLTGLFTHPSPRSQLLFLYGSTLEKLKDFPESSVYRQSTEAVTKHRLKIIEQLKPAGYDEWMARAVEKLKENPEMISPGHSRYKIHKVGDTISVIDSGAKDTEDSEWDGEEGIPTFEGPKGEREARLNDEQFGKAVRYHEEQEAQIDWEPEPPLESTQIHEAETQIGAGLIEEVIQVAEGEHKLVDIMSKHKVWEELEDKAPADQWVYFARDQHTPGTQEPASK